MRCDVVIVGGGPAGAAAARSIVDCATVVLIQDKYPPINARYAELISGDALHLLGLIGLPVPSGLPHAPAAVILSSWSTAELVASDGFVNAYGCSWLLDRDAFDQSLREAIAKSGVLVLNGRVIACTRSNDQWIVRLDDGRRFEARWLVDAGGRRSSIARWLGVRRNCDAPLTALYATGNPCDPSLRHPVVEADAHGWWYAAQMPSGIPFVGLHLDPRDARTIVGCLPAFLALLRETRHLARLMRCISINRLLAPCDGASQWLSRFDGCGWVACGDAAIAMDPISGQGIFAALYSGMSAGREVCSALENGEEHVSTHTGRLARFRQAYVRRYRSAYRDVRPRSARFWRSRS